MKNFKVTFRNTSNNIDFVTVDSENQGIAIDLCIVNGISIESIISIDDVTGKFVDSDGTIKPR